MKNRFFVNLVFAAALMIGFMPAQAQFDDVYYDPDTDVPYYDYDYENTSSDFSADEYYYDDEEYGYYDDYDYYYSSRIKRFQRGCGVFDFYDPFYTDYYYYDPFYYRNYYSPGVSIYFSFGSPYRPWRSWHNPYNHYYTSYYYNSWADPWYDPWYSPWYGGYGNHYYTGYYGYGGYNHYGNYNNYAYNNYYYDNDYYYNNSNKGNNKYYGSRYDASGVSSRKGKPNKSGIVGVPDKSKLDKLGDPGNSSGRNTGSVNVDKGKTGVKEERFKGDREITPNFENERKQNTKTTREWVPFDNNRKEKVAPRKEVEPKKEQKSKIYTAPERNKKSTAPTRENSRYNYDNDRSSTPKVDTRKSRKSSTNSSTRSYETTRKSSSPGYKSSGKNSSSSSSSYKTPKSSSRSSSSGVSSSRSSSSSSRSSGTSSGSSGKSSSSSSSNSRSGRR